MSNDDDISSYTADFRSIFGSDVHKDDNSNELSTSGSKEHRQTTSVPPASLVSTDAVPYEHISTRNPDSDITPSILLEQLAYVDNFMPSLEQDFANLDSWVMGDNDFGNTGSGNPQGIQQHNAMGVDERLALELNAFADDSFIFPDEDKSQIMRHDGRGSEPTDDKSADSVNENNTNSHFLTQRRNTFLTSQYDHSKSRFSSRKRRKTTNNDDDATISNHSSSNSPNQDHGGFANFDIVSNGSNNNPGSGNNIYTPSVASPLNNLRASQSLAGLNSPVVSPAVATPASTSHNSLHPQIQMPDYSSIPTSTLVSLLPKVKVPPGAYRSLINRGLDPDQISAIAVIVAHHEQEKIKQHRNFSSNQLENLYSSQDAARNASFLLDVLSRGNSKNSSTTVTSQIERKKEDGRRRSSVEVGSQNSPQFKEQTLEKNKKTSKASNKLAELQTRGDTGSRRSSPSEGAAPLVKKRDNSSSSVELQTQKSHQKRKLKENELEASVHELSELAISLQQKIHTLEMENRLLKNLVTSSGELEGIEKAENIRKELLSKITADDEKDGDDTNEKQEKEESS